ncbi:GNAT family N-acetyltransferase [Oceanirhabdus sp. W0125-5]|uniref:GNAT family N-acetyltransferase n=1 Tax=Oceanirhabdus sp. W0125-5 TaxID=2999116 RepID=UPI0022F32004|nr:GNAT family protein [Oceanirhabdus sp. W0125-5]WBW94866.1 GNAT family protein [Oceanirhabdus sp. W0125-5]
MQYLKKIVGEKCYLAPVDDSLTEKVAIWSNDLRVSIRTGDISDMITYETQKEYLNSMNQRGYAFYIVDNTDNEAIGIIRLMRVNHINRNAVLGIFIGESTNRNSGIGTEATKLILDFAFNVINLRNVMIETFSFNHRAIKVCKKVGFKEIGRRRNAIIYGDNEFDEVFMDILNTEFSDSIICEALK